MELWVSGFNAWNQLQFDGELPAEPRDLVRFTCVLKSEYIEILSTSISATLIQTSSGKRVAGSPDGFILHYSGKNDCLQSAVVAGNDKVVEYASGSLIQYSSMQAYLHKDGHSFEGFEDIEQIAANQTSFTALSSNGTVYTWGDGRYEACLGREVTKESPASKPSIVEELSELPDKVESISSGGYVTAALTSGNDVYFWGRAGQPELSESLSDSPTPLDIDGHDFLDVGVGVNHMMVLTTERKLFVIGAGHNGQLGLGLDSKELRDWKEVCLPLKNGQQLVSVFAGYKNSFVLVEDMT